MKKWSLTPNSALGGLSNYAKSFGGKMAISAIVGGTASRLGGGKFANGAVSAAFVHMYNAMSHPTYPSKENFIEGFTKDVSRAYRALSMMVRSQSFGARGLSSLSYGQAYDRVLRIEAMNEKVLDGIGLGLSVASAVSPMEIAIRLGGAAIAIDVIQGDPYGIGIGGMAMYRPNAITVATDLIYGTYQLYK